MKNKSEIACVVVFQFVFTRLADHLGAYMKGLILKCLSLLYFFDFLTYGYLSSFKTANRKKALLLFIWVPFERVIIYKHPLKTALENRWSRNQGEILEKYRWTSSLFRKVIS